jgi:hypothetical protein
MHNADAAFHCPAGPQSGVLVPRYLAGLVPLLAPQKAPTIPRPQSRAPFSLRRRASPETELGDVVARCRAFQKAMALFASVAGKIPCVGRVGTRGVAVVGNGTQTPQLSERRSQMLPPSFLKQRGIVRTKRSRWKCPRKVLKSIISYALLNARNARSRYASDHARRSYIHPFGYSKG